MTSNYVFIARHGSTELNDPDDERLRSWSGVPLSDDGRDEVRKSAQALKKDPPHSIFTSDLPRARETADIINEVLGGHIPVHDVAQLRPWNLGALQGKHIKDAAGELDRLHRNYNDKPPKGESYKEFYKRWGRALEEIRKLRQKSLLVVHARNVYSLPSLLTNGEKPIPVMGPPHPSDILKLDDKGSLSYFYRSHHHERQSGKEQAETQAQSRRVSG